MEPSRRVPTLEAKVSFRCSFREEEELKAEAEEAGLTVSQYVRKELLERRKVPPYVRLIVAEAVKTQILVGSVVATTANGNRITPSEFKEQVNDADLRKFAKADGLLESLKER
jgi:hypothetical protein